ncbi:hypothetical protein BO86DRAFT_13396 [Aspergillus japonicus CBS 114.51]|uniref:Uncharacterized protein n=1 Tax=Aspergillus japonicus CBS 114.51 TaxID=1448312 RepID=A0A8T8X813_ASPJA|nr:hypothetical protein BO86DRAFT_13396 [Aspergillus japonicus CBS 114.51]RAH84140.1 hypothetical protein BO86DRAFT_13396 [Aspergillus japonicus CBS 114.51]
MCHKIRYYFSVCICIDVSRDVDIRCDKALKVGYECTDPKATGIPMKGICPHCQEYYQEYHKVMSTPSEPEAPVPESQKVDICKSVEERPECHSGTSVPEGHEVNISNDIGKPTYSSGIPVPEDRKVSICRNTEEEPRCDSGIPIPEGRDVDIRRDAEDKPERQPDDPILATQEVDNGSDLKRPKCHFGIPVPRRQGVKASSDVEEPRRVTGIPAPVSQEMKARGEVDKKARCQFGLPVLKNQEAKICNQVEEKPKRQSGIPLPRKQEVKTSNEVGTKPRIQSSIPLPRKQEVKTRNKPAPDLQNTDKSQSLDESLFDRITF